MSNDIKSLQSYEKWLNIFENLQNKSGPTGILFLQETHSTKESQIRPNNSQIHYSQGEANSNTCGDPNAFFGSITYTVRKKAPDKLGRILIIEALIDGTEFILINLNNANAENDKLTTFSKLII